MDIAEALRNHTLLLFLRKDHTNIAPIAILEVRSKNLAAGHANLQGSTVRVDSVSHVLLNKCSTQLWSLYTVISYLMSEQW